MTRYLIALILLSAVTVAAQNTSSYDFEQSEGFAHYEGLHSGDAVAEIVVPGADGKGHCLRFTSRARGLLLPPRLHARIQARLRRAPCAVPQLAGEVLTAGGLRCQGPGRGQVFTSHFCRNVPGIL